MKKVHLLVGSLGAALPIFGMVPVPTQAATHPSDQPAKSKGKTVSVLGASRSSAQTAATSSSTSFMNNSPSTGNSKVPCTGVKEYTKTKNMESQKFWSGPLGNPISYNCIGTVEGKWFDWSDNPDWLYRVKIYSHGNWTTPVYNKKTGGTALNHSTQYGQQGIHKWYRAPVRVCTTWYHSSADSHGSIALLCRTID